MKGFLMNKFQVVATSWSEVVIIPERMLHLMHDTTSGRQVVEIPALLRALLIRLCQLKPEAELHATFPLISQELDLLMHDVQHFYLHVPNLASLPRLPPNQAPPPIRRQHRHFLISYRRMRDLQNALRFRSSFMLRSGSHQP